MELEARFQCQHLRFRVEASDPRSLLEHPNIEPETLQKPGSRVQLQKLQCKINHKHGIHDHTWRSREALKP